MGEPETIVKGTGDEKVTNEGTVSQADFDALQAENATLKKDNEDARLEVFTDDYMTYLDKKDKGPAPVATKPAATVKDPLADDNLENMSKKDILALATTTAEASVKVQLDAMRQDQSNYRRGKVSETVRDFAAGHEDYEQYRPIMFGLSKDPKNANASLTQLYDMAIKHVEGISGISKEAKIKQIKSGGERPGGFSDSFKADKIMSASEATAEAVKEVEDKLGPLPPM